VLHITVRRGPPLLTETSGGVVTTGLMVWYWVSSLLLAVLIFRPAKKFIMASKVRRLEGKLKRQLTDREIQEIEKKTIPVTALIVVTFSLVFNRLLISKFFLSR
jgi:hypothetical protein